MKRDVRLTRCLIVRWVGEWTSPLLPHRRIGRKFFKRHAYMGLVGGRAMFSLYDDDEVGDGVSSARDKFAMTGEAEIRIRQKNKQDKVELKRGDREARPSH